MNHALNMDTNPDNYEHGYSQETNFNEGFNYFDDLDFSKAISSQHISNSMVQDNTTSNPLYHHLNTFVKDITMYVKDEDVSMRNYVTEKMCSLLKDCMLYSDGKFEPLSLERREQVQMVTNKDEVNNSTYLCYDGIVEVCKDQTSPNDIKNDDEAHEQVGNVINTFPSTYTRKNYK